MDLQQTGGFARGFKFEGYRYDFGATLFPVDDDRHECRPTP
ncbi:hypothetical protein [Novosphingobium sp. ERN07]|nr:hypothetical protein [Novosphingobium sp. ERN07]